LRIIFVKMIKRNIESEVKETMKFYPIIVITGPRQSGKTTFLKNAFPDFEYISFENPDVRLFIENDTNGFLEKHSEKVIFDEVQLIPNLFSYLQTKVDATGKMGQFILSGSQNFNLMKNITQSLAGRVAPFKLLPLDNNELKTSNLLPSDYSEAIIRGFYPALFDRQIPTTTFYANYVDTYVQRDLKDLLRVKDLQAFKVFLKLCAARLGQQLNISNLAKDAGISTITAKSWLSILETSYVLYTLPPFYKNFNKRLVKTPKLYFFDTGVACFLLGIKNEKSLTESNFKGALFENLIINEYTKQNYNSNLQRNFYYWRDSNGHEVDLMISNNLAYDIVEIKATKTIMSNLFYGLDMLASIGAEDINVKTLVYGGAENQNRTNYKVKSWQDVEIEN
jgi:uncharacterized protein